MLPHARATILSNGLPIIAVPMEDREMTTVMVYVRGGSRGESPAQRGISHLIEHLVFKGSKGFRDPSAIDFAVADIGGYTNAETQAEYVAYFIRVPQRNAGEALRILSDMVLHPLFLAEHFTKEKRVVFQELLKNIQDDEDYSCVLLEDLLYGHQPLGWEIGGTIKTVAKVTRGDIERFYRKWYVGRQMAVAIVGGGDVARLAKEAAGYFSSCPRGAARRWRPFDGTRRGRIRNFHRDGTMVSMAVGVPGVAFGAPSGMAQRVAEKLLSDEGWSRLFRRLREKDGAVYRFGTESSAHSDAGHLFTQTQVSSGRAQSVMDAIVDEYRRFARDPITVRELSQSKERLHAELGELTQNLDALAQWHAKEFLFGGALRQLEAERKDIDRLDLETVRAAAGRLVNGGFYAATVGDRPLTLPK